MDGRMTRMGTGNPWFNIEHRTLDGYAVTRITLSASPSQSAGS